MISQRVIFWWRFLPPRTRCWYEAEDMIGDVVLHVVRMTDRYDPSLAKEVTWVHHVADNKCRAILTRHKAQSRAACETVELTPLLARKVGADDVTEKRQSLDAVYRVIERSSEAVCDLIDMLFSDVRPSRDEARDRWLEEDREVVEELRQTVWECGATMDDFAAVLRCAVE